MKQSLFTEITKNTKGLNPSLKEDEVKYLEAVNNAVDNADHESVKNALKIYIFNSIFKNLINPIQTLNETKIKNQDW